MDTRDVLYQLLLLVIAIIYKYLLYKENVWGWILGATSSLLSAFYIFLYFKLYVVMSLELSFMFLSLYGVYKYIHKNKLLTRIDYLIIVLTIIIIAYLGYKQIQTNTIWYEILGSISFLSGVIFLAQENKISKIIGWALFFSGSVCMGTILYKNGAWILVALHFISLFLAINAIIRIARFSK